MLGEGNQVRYVLEVDHVAFTDLAPSQGQPEVDDELRATGATEQRETGGWVFGERSGPAVDRDAASGGGAPGASADALPGGLAVPDIRG
jgi:hypothetical protein